MVISCEPRLGGRPWEAAVDGASPNRNLAPLTTRLDDQGRLEVGGCRLSELARTFGARSNSGNAPSRVRGQARQAASASAPAMSRRSVRTTRPSA